MKKKILCDYLGGSHAYGLNISTSDLDHRGVFKLMDPGAIINPRSHNETECETLVKTLENDNEDSVYYELRHFLHLLGKGNMTAIEMLFNKNWVSIEPLMNIIQESKNSLVDPEKLKYSVTGYSTNEYELAIGSRTGKLGGKRNEIVARLGFSPKNFVNLFRILYSAETFFETGVYPVDLRGSYIHPQLMEIKSYPERFTKARLTAMKDERVKAFELSWYRYKRSICHDYQYDKNKVTELVIKCYLDDLSRNNTAVTRSFLGRIADKIARLVP